MMPRLYAIVDAQVLAARGFALEDFARELRAAGVELVQYRDKTGSPREVLRAAAVLREVCGAIPRVRRSRYGAPNAGATDHE